jgi:hypothetical protein
MAIEFERKEIAGGLPDGYIEWKSGPYKIICYSEGEYYAYYDSKHVCKPPHTTPCTGCGSAFCKGIHKVWNNLETAKDDCILHAANLPW